jgi:MFS family permease
MFGMPRAVWLLGWVSLATDSATEAIYPLLPYFLTSVLGAGAISLGIIEGAAEAANSVLKIWSGRAADRQRRRRPLVLLGYSISSLARPVIALTTSWFQVFVVRVLDRVGKGIRGAPRDAMLARWATQTNRGRIYGFHRAMDHIGAILGPLAATVFLFFFPDRYRTLFALAIIPGAIAVGLIFWVPERGIEPSARDSHDPRPASRKSPADASGTLPPVFNRFIQVMALFTLGNSSDAFLLLKLTDAAGSAKLIPLCWAALHVVKASISIIGGLWSDRVGRRSVIAIGWLIYACVYAGFALTTRFGGLVGWFLVYGFYFGFSEGTEKALVADLAPGDRRGFAFGVYNAVQGLGALAASVLFGAIWSALGSRVAFMLGAGLAVVSTALLFAVIPADTGEHRARV